MGYMLLFSRLRNGIRSHNILSAAILSSAIVVAGGVLYWTEFRWFTLDESKIEALDAQSTTDASRFLFDKAIGEFKQLDFIYRIKGDTDLAARMRIKIGFQYDKDGDYLTGLPILKKVAFDERLSPWVRSEALARIIMAYSGNEKLEILQAIFDDPHPLMKDALGTGSLENIEDLRKAAIRLLEKANSLHEYAYLDYLIAARKSYVLIGELNSFDKEEVAARKKEILSLIQKGDALTEIETKQSDFKRGGFNSDFFSSGQSQKLQAYAELSRLDSRYAQSAADVYDGLQTMRDTYYKTGYAAPSFLGTESFIRFYYAAMLAHLDGVRYRKEIESVMAPTMIGDGNWGVANRKITWRFYENELSKTGSQRTSNQESIMEIASVFPRFDAFLIGKGWIDDHI